MKTGPTEAHPLQVPGATPSGDVRDRWSWTEPAIWTDRMLTALEHGVKGGVWFSLVDKIYADRTLQAAFTKVKSRDGSAGVDHQTIAMFERDLEANLARLAEELRSGRYEPRPARRVYIPKPGSRKGRPLGIPTVRDRVAQAAMVLVLEPIFERDFAEHSYGFRPGRSCKDALREVDRLLKEGFTWVVDVDLANYFDTIRHDRLLELIRTKVVDRRVLKLIESCLKQDVMEDMEQWTPERGTPQGAVLSPLLSNIYLNPLDHEMAAADIAMVRYADDLVVMCRSRDEAEAAHSMLARWAEETGLSLHSEKTRIVDATRETFEFLGYWFTVGRRGPRPKSVRNLRDRIRAETRRTSGDSLPAIINRINPVLRGWFEYFKHSRRPTIVWLDGWVRMRLRSILRKRHRGRGRGRGADHQRWPNAYFTAHGLFSLAAAYDAARQSPQG